MLSILTPLDLCTCGHDSGEHAHDDAHDCLDWAWRSWPDRDCPYRCRFPGCDCPDMTK